MTLARFHGQWCRTVRPHLKPGIILQAPPTSSALNERGFRQRVHDYDKHFYRHFQPEDSDIDEIVVFGPATWNGIRVHTTGIVLIDGRSYTDAFVFASLPLVPPDHGTWGVEQYDSPLTGHLLIENLRMDRIRLEQAEDWSMNG